jgi:hypothetical protein
MRGVMIVMVAAFAGGLPAAAQSSLRAAPILPIVAGPTASAGQKSTGARQLARAALPVCQKGQRLIRKTGRCEAIVGAGKSKR